MGTLGGSALGAPVPPLGGLGLLRVFIGVGSGAGLCSGAGALLPALSSEDGALVQPIKAPTIRSRSKSE